MKNFLMRVINSRPYLRSKKLAINHLKNPETLHQLAVKAENRTDRVLTGKIAECKETILTFSLLIKAYAKGEYREIPWNSLLLITASLLYFVFPFDLLPDFLVALGFFDDAALIGWTLKSVKQDLDRFKAATSP